MEQYFEVSKIDRSGREAEVIIETSASDGITKRFAAALDTFDESVPGPARKRSVDELTELAYRELINKTLVTLVGAVRSAPESVRERIRSKTSFLLPLCDEFGGKNPPDDD